MHGIQARSKIAMCFITLLVGSTSSAQRDVADSHTTVSMRMIGHQVLLSVGDSTSRVLPVEQETTGYRIRFASEFQFDPDALAATIDRVIAETRIASSYLVEVQQCYSHEVVYSYEVGVLPDKDLLACKGRMQPLGCYSLLISIVSSEQPALLSAIPAGPARTKITLYAGGAVLICGLLALVGLVRYRKKRKGGVDPNLIQLGAYRFDPRNMELVLGRERNALTGKEADLLSLLHASANTTVERDVILNNVWGDEGDYVGRTLDVFISKLRKKLDADPTVKIVNTRGVGYKLVLNDPV